MLTVLGEDCDRNTGNRNLSTAGFCGGNTGESGNHDGSGFGLPPRVDNWGGVGADDLSVPHPRLGVDGFPHSAEHPEAGEVKLLRDLTPQLHERANSGGGGVKNCDPILLDDFPPTPRVWGIRSSLIDHLGGTVGQGSIDDVAVSGNPADVGGAPIHICFSVQVENILVREGSLGEVSPRRVQDAFGFAGGA